MKYLYLTLAAAMVLPCAADISIGTARRPVATAEQPADRPDLTAEKAALLEAIKLMTDEKGAAAAEKQLNAKKVGKALAPEQDKKMHAMLMQNIPESGYDASGAHDIGGDKAPTPRKEKTPPPLRPLPPELQ